LGGFGFPVFGQDNFFIITFCNSKSILKAVGFILMGHEHSGIIQSRQLTALDAKESNPLSLPSQREDHLRVFAIHYNY
jgi:hypothetical protein